MDGMQSISRGVVVRGAVRPEDEGVLTPDAVAFAAEFEREFGAERRRLLDLFFTFFSCRSMS